MDGSSLSYSLFTILAENLGWVGTVGYPLTPCHVWNSPALLSSQVLDEHLTRFWASLRQTVDTERLFGNLGIVSIHIVVHLYQTGRVDLIDYPRAQPQLLSYAVLVRSSLLRMSRRVLC